MPNNLGLGVIAELQRERIGFAVDHDCFPPAIFGGLLSDHQMTWRDLVPGLLVVRRAHQRNAGALLGEPGQVREIPVLQDERGEGVLSRVG